MHTNAVDIELNFRAQDLVPAVDGVDQVAAALPAAGAAQWVSERGIGREVGVDDLLLFGGRTLGELVNDAADFLDGVVHD